MRKAPALLAVLAALAAAPSVNAIPLDRTFSGDGIFTAPNFSSGSPASVRAIAIQPDGKVVLAGQWVIPNFGNAFTMLRLLPDGTPETDFGQNGRVAHLIGGNEGIRDVALQPDGKILAVGETTAGGSGVDVAVARYNPNGTLDEAEAVDGTPGSFDGDGLARLALDGDQRGRAVALQSTGNIVVAGRSGTNFGGPDFFVARLKPDGTPDTGFFAGGAGNVDITGPTKGDFLYAMLVQPDDKIVLAGQSDMGATTRSDKFSLVRIKPDGGLDDGNGGFGGDGVVTTSFPNRAGAGIRALARQPDGRIVAAGFAVLATADVSGSDFALARYLPDGRLDNSGPGAFGGDGRLTTAVSPGKVFDDAYGVALQPDGKIVAAGNSAPGDDVQFSLARYTPSGALDPTFDLDGKLVHGLSSPGIPDEISSIVAVGRKLVVGGTITPSGVDDDFAAARYLQHDRDSDGRADRADNCPNVANFGQANRDKDARGDACDKVIDGTPKADTLIGSARAEIFDGHGGADTIRARGAADTLRGGRGGDTLNGGTGRDKFRGGEGNDTIRAADGEKDDVRCGKGKDDRATVDVKDDVKGCESVTRP